jgi:hypothetical protein
LGTADITSRRGKIGGFDPSPPLGAAISRKAKEWNDANLFKNIIHRPLDENFAGPNSFKTGLPAFMSGNLWK